MTLMDTDIKDMTVQQLIDILEKVEDKSVRVIISSPIGHFISSPIGHPYHVSLGSRPGDPIVILTE